MSGRPWKTISTALWIARSVWPAPPRLAEGFGCFAEEVTRFEDIAPAVRRAQAQAGPACLNIMTDADVAHPITAMMIGRLDSEDEIAIPYYENIPLRPWLCTQSAENSAP